MTPSELMMHRYMEMCKDLPEADQVDIRLFPEGLSA